jgi:hypothetical protein
MILTNLPFFAGMNGLGNQLIPSTRLLCRLTVGPQTRNNNIQLHIDDASKKLEVAMKLFAKRGKSKAALEADDHPAADSENDD